MLTEPRTPLLKLFVGCVFCLIGLPIFGRQDSNAQMYVVGEDGRASAVKQDLFVRYDIGSFAAKLQKNRQSELRSMKSRILDDEGLQDWLDLTQDQKTQLKNLWEKHTMNFKTQVQPIRERIELLRKEGSSNGNDITIVEELSQLNDQISSSYDELLVHYEQDFDKILLPIQIQIISEAAAYSIVSQMIPESDKILWPIYIAKALGYPNDEIDAIRAQTLKSIDEVQASISKIREEAFEKVLNSASTKHREELLDYIGESPSFQKQKAKTGR